jgi:hypothetical protein
MGEAGITEVVGFATEMDSVQVERERALLEEMGSPLQSERYRMRR